MSARRQTRDIDARRPRGTRDTLRTAGRRCRAFLIVAGIGIVPPLSVQAQAPRPFVPFDTDRFPWVNGVVFSSDDQEMFLTLLFHDYLSRTGRSSEGMPEVALFYSRRHQGSWTEPELLPISGTYHDYEPTISSDGSIMIFNSRRPYVDGRTPPDNDLWMTRRSAGEWGPPTRIEPVSTFENDESYSTLATDGTLIYMGSRTGSSGVRTYDLYQSRHDGDGFSPPERHPVSTDLWGEGDPWVAPDLTYLIYTRWDEAAGWAETVDMYISFWDGTGWSIPEPLEDVNTAGADYSPSVSPDGAWLYYRVDGEYLRRPLAPILERHRPDGERVDLDTDQPRIVQDRSPE